MKVRPATKADIPTIVAMGQEFVQVPGYKDRLRIEPKVFADRLDTQLAWAPGALVLVLETDAGICGAIGAYCAPSIFTNDLNAVETFWFVKPEARKNGGGRLLLDAVIAWAKERNALSLNMIEPPDAPNVGALYEKLGFAKFETYWNLPCR